MTCLHTLQIYASAVASQPAHGRVPSSTRSLPEGPESTASPLSTFRSGPATTRGARGSDEASGSGKANKEVRAVRDPKELPLSIFSVAGPTASKGA